MPAARLLVLSLLPLLLPARTPSAALPQEGETTIEALVDEIERRGDAGEVDPIQRLADKRTPEALEALLDVYTKLGSVYMRRAVLQGVAQYDEVEGQEQRALQTLLDAATLSTDRELRLAAVDLIGRCRNLGRPFLRILVDSHADDEVREEALKRHAGNATAADMQWYRQLWTGVRPEPEGRRRRGRDDEEEEPPPPLLPVLREIAFEALASTLDMDELEHTATGGWSAAIRLRAVQELEARGGERALELVEELFEARVTRPEARLYAAKVLLREHGPDFADELIDEATRSVAAELFALGVAELLDDLDDEDVDKDILRKVGKGKGLEKLFWLRAARGLDDEKVDKALVKLIDDRDTRVARTAMAYIAARRMFDAREDLEELAEDTDDPALLTEALKALCALRPGDEEWEAELVEYTRSEERAVRNAALRALAETDDERYVEVLAAALTSEDWSTRLAAVSGLQELRVAAAVGPLVQQLGREQGRMALEVSDALVSLTGQDFGRNAALWESWWQDARQDFEVVDTASLRKLRRQQEERRLRQVTRTEFFGVKVESHRLTFVLDVSGSMMEPTRTRYADEAGRQRIEVAKRELLRVLGAMDRRSFFNLIVFSGGVDAWAEEITPFDDEVLADAKEYVGRLGAGGGTNLYGALELAFEDPEVDTIYVLSDGEPTVGDVVDPAAIRARVADWNEDRGVVVHTIAVGGSLQVLEWIAKDTGGTYVRFP